jgi:predicted lipid-binding transport protein (Tim44 family)
MLAGLLVVPSFLFLGVAAGVWIATLNPTGMGWDQLADALGGMMIGGLAGLGLGIVAITRLPAARLRTFTIVTLVAALAVSSILAVRARNRRNQLGVDSPPGEVTTAPPPVTRDAPAATTAPVEPGGR